MRKMGIYWKLLTKRAFALISCLLAILLCFAAGFSLSACGDEEAYDLEVGGDYRTVAVWDTGIVDRKNVTTDHYGHKTFGVVPGETWGAYVKGGNGYFTYKIQGAQGKQFESLKIDVEAYYSYKFKENPIFPYEMTDENGDCKTNIIVECSYDGKNFWEVYNFNDKHKEEFTNNENEYVGDNAIEIDLSMDYSYKVGVLYVRFNIIHMTYKDFVDTDNVDSYNGKNGENIFGKSLDGTLGIELHRLGVRFYSAFIRGNYAETDKK